MIGNPSDSELMLDPANDDGLRSGNQNQVTSRVSPDDRRFNENDVLGLLDRDQENGLVIPFNEADRGLLDKYGRRINKAGYLVDEEGNIIN